MPTSSRFKKHSALVVIFELSRDAMKALISSSGTTHYDNDHWVVALDGCEGWETGAMKRCKMQISVNEHE